MKEGENYVNVNGARETEERVEKHAAETKRKEKLNSSHSNNFIINKQEP